jgi:hypothetical protein
MHTPSPSPEHRPDGPTDHGLTATGRGAPSPGYETTDVSVPGILVFLVSLCVFVFIFFVFCFGMGKVINNALRKHDGPLNRWSAAVYNAQGPKPAKTRDLESNAAIEQQQLALMTSSFPTPRLEADDGNQDVAILHAREDLLLDHYTWVDQPGGTLRIPIGVAMELVAQRGLPVVNAGETPQVIADDSRQAITAPLTNGFARTGYEQELEVEQARRQETHEDVRPPQQARKTPTRTGKPDEQAALHPAR